jgi:hypothetical protein
LVTPLHKLSGTKIAGAPPKYSTIRTWAAIHAGNSWEGQASAYT